MDSERLMEWAELVRQAATGAPPRSTHTPARTPPVAVFRPNPSGRRAWLAQAERGLRQDLSPPPPD